MDNQSMETIQEEAVQNIAAAMEDEAPTEGEPVRNRYADQMNGRRRVPKPVKIGLAALVIAGLFAGGFYLVNKTGKPPEKVQGETIAYAARGYLETYIEGSGSVAARTQVELGKELKGKVTEVLVQPGQAVKTGDTLFVVEPTEIREQLDEARRDMTETQRGLDEAAANLETAYKNVSELTVTAPFAGRLLPPEESKTWREGDELGAGTVLGTLVDDSVIKLPLYFSYAYVDAIVPGAAATVSIPANMSSVAGTVDSVERIEKISDDGVKLFRATVRIDNPGALKKGMTATAEIMTASGGVLPAEAGTLEYNREEAVTVKQSGKIVRVAGLEYYRFEQGAVLVQQSSDELTRAVDSAKRALESQQQIAIEKQKNITELETIIANSVVTSPIDGVVLKMDAAVDTTLAGGTAPCVVADMSSLVVKARILMNDINTVLPGQQASITLYTDESAIFTGTVESVAMQADENSGNGNMPTYTAVVVLDPLPEGVSIAMDMEVNYRITTAQVEDCITIPSRALVNTEEGVAVFARAQEGQTFEQTLPMPEGVKDIPEGFVLVPVSVGISDSSNVEILFGIEEGTEVFLAGPQDMYEAMNQMGEAAVG